MRKHDGKRGKRRQETASRARTGELLHATVDLHRVYPELLPFTRKMSRKTGGVAQCNAEHWSSLREALG